MAWLGMRSCGDARRACQVNLTVVSSRKTTVGDHRKLEIYRLACELSDRVEDMVEHLPPKVRTRLGDQLVRAAESIHLNIAEGCGFNSEPLLKKHTNYAIASANEVEDALAKLDRRKLLRVAVFMNSAEELSHNCQGGLQHFGHGSDG
jgi:four helix bundle protein